MKKTQLAKLNMYRAVHELLNSHQDAWSGTPAFANANNAFSERLSLLIQNGQKQKVVRTGVTAAKKAIVKQSATMAYVLAGALKAYAVTSDNAVLFAKLDWTRTNLLKGRMQTVLGRLRELEELFIVHQSELADYGIQPADIEAFSAQLVEHEASLLTPLHARNECTLITEAIVRLIDELDEVLEFQMDPLVRVLQEDHPEFALQYFKSRVIIDPGVRHRAENQTDGGEDVAGQNPERDDGSPQESAA